MLLHMCAITSENIEASTYPLKEEIVLCLISMVKTKLILQEGFVKNELWWFVACERKHPHFFFLTEEEISVLFPSSLTKEKGEKNR